MQTITVDSVTPKEGQRPWKVRSNGDEYVTWDDGDGQLLKSLQGLQVQIDFENRSKTRDGRTFSDKVITNVMTPDEVAPSHRENEPNINTAKQVVIIRQNAWGQAQHVYETALAVLQARGEDVTVDALQKVVEGLLPGMADTASSIEANIRRFWFPSDAVEEPPF
jgi:hypothetical protein